MAGWLADELIETDGYIPIFIGDFVLLDAEAHPSIDTCPISQL
jgi:hypothetical protein